MFEFWLSGDLKGVGPPVVPGGHSENHCPRVLILRPDTSTQ